MTIYIYIGYDHPLVIISIYQVLDHITFAMNPREENSMNMFDMDEVKRELPCEFCFFVMDCLKFGFLGQNILIRSHGVLQGQF